MLLKVQGIFTDQDKNIKVHANSLKSNRLNYGYVLVNKENKIMKFGESVNPQRKYTNKYLNPKGDTMNLFINSPAYYTRKYGIDNDVYNFCNYISRNISRNIDKKKYTNAIDTIGIVPMIAPKEVLDELHWKSRQYVSRAYRMADISISMDFQYEEI